MNKQWVSKSVGELCRCFAGGTPSRSIEEYFKGDIPWVTSGEVNADKIHFTNENITHLALNNSSAKMIPKGSILVAMYGATAGEISQLMIDGCSNQAVLAVIPHEEIDTTFLYYELKFLKENIIYLAQGSGQPNLSKDLVERTNINFPREKSQQTQIAKILTTIDNVIERTEEATAKYEAIKEGMMHDLFTRGIGDDGKLRPAKEEAPELYKETELGWIPKEWEIKLLGDCGNFSKGANIPKYLLDPSGVDCILYGQLYTRFHNTIERAESKIPEDHVKGMIPLEFGTILFAGSGETHAEIGISAVFLSETTAYAGGDIVLLSLSEDYFKPYFGYFLNFDKIQRQKARLGQGSSVIHIYSKHLSSIKLSMPEITEQEKIFAKIDKISSQIKIEKENLNKLLDLKKGLMQDLLTGKVPVKPTLETVEI